MSNKLYNPHAGSEPKDVYRRHDNCGCSVTYENVRQDVWSKRTWEAPEPGAGAGDPVVFTESERPSETPLYIFEVDFLLDNLHKRIYNKVENEIEAIQRQAEIQDVINQLRENNIEMKVILWK